MSVRNFVRRFKQATGDSPLAYLQKLRIAAAKRMLESNHRTILRCSTDTVAPTEDCNALEFINRSVTS